MIRVCLNGARSLGGRLSLWPGPGDFRPAPIDRRGAVTVEYALVMLIAAAMLVGVEKEIFQPMAKDILKDFMEFIVKPDP